MKTFLRCLGLAAGLYGTSCGAHVFCVTTSAELGDALGQVSFNEPYSNEDSTIEIAAGTYPTPQNGFGFDSLSGATITIVGGYNSDCTASTQDASLTVLDGGNVNPVLTTFDGGLTVISNLTVQNGESTETAAGLRINDYLDTFIGFEGPVRLSNLIVRNNHSSAGVGGIFVWAGRGEFTMSNCLIVGNSGDNGAGGAAIDSEATATNVFGNTITRNTGPNVAGSVGGIAFGSDNPATASNNIFWANSGIDAAIGATVNLLYNDYGNLSSASVMKYGNALLDPMFVDPDNGDFHLMNGSPLIEFSPILEGTDLEGHPHPADGKEDIGAYFDAIFSSSFEPPGATPI